jgi:hypothetical protein
MTKEELIKLHETLSIASREIMIMKNNDYASATGNDPFANFRGSSFLGVEPEIGILMRSMDKFKRIETFVRTNNLEVKSESVQDAILDVINYMILLAGIIKDKERIN